MNSLRIMSLFLLLIIFGFSSGCGLRQKYKIDREGDRPGNNSSQSQRSLKNKKSEYGKSNTHQLIELGRLIQSYLGRPYSGKSKYAKGFDCSQFMMELFLKFNGTSLPRTAKAQSQYGYSVNKGEIQYGDLLFFRTEGRKPSHVGVYVGFDEFVHSSTSSGIIISSLKNKYWKKRFLGGRRIIR